MQSFSGSFASAHAWSSPFRAFAKILFQKPLRGVGKKQVLAGFFKKYKAVSLAATLFLAKFIRIGYAYWAWKTNHECWFLNEVIQEVRSSFQMISGADVDIEDVIFFARLRSSFEKKIKNGKDLKLYDVAYLSGYIAVALKAEQRLKAVNFPVGDLRKGHLPASGFVRYLHKLNRLVASNNPSPTAYTCLPVGSATDG